MNQGGEDLVRLMFGDDRVAEYIEIGKDDEELSEIANMLTNLAETFGVQWGDL